MRKQTKLNQDILHAVTHEIEIINIYILWWAHFFLYMELLEILNIIIEILVLALRYWVKK